MKKSGDKMRRKGHILTGSDDNEAVRSPFPRERKHRRFDLSYPVELKLLSGRPRSKLHTTSRNVSLGGLLLETSSVIAEYSRVSFTMMLQRTALTRPILLEGKGKVVRVEPQLGGGFAVAIECSRPLKQIEHYLPATSH